MRRACCCAFLLASVAFLPVSRLVSAGYRPPSDAELAKICPNALKVGDPSCRHGGRLHADNSTKQEPERYNNCVQCDCPPGWSGIDCSLCDTKDVCPLWRDPATGDRIAATGCSSDALLPTSFELHHGKRLTCDCGGADGDWSTSWACKQQPYTHWEAEVRHPNGTDKPAELLLVERAGMPSQDDRPGNCPGPNGKPVTCPSAQRYKYAYPVVWEGTFGGCRWATGDCISPLKGSDCVTLSCDTSSVICPPNYVEKCPGYKATSCGRVPGEGKATYWMHRCNPLAVPANGSSIRLACEPQRANHTRAFQCYIAQEHSFMASLGMRCTTGGCLYNTGGPAPPMPPVPHEHKTNWAEWLVTSLIAAAVVGVMAAVGLLVTADSRKSAAQMALLDVSSNEEPLQHVAAVGGTAANGSSIGGAMQPVVLSWSRISCHVPKGMQDRRKRVLRSVSGIAGMPAGVSGGNGTSCMTAILGPSGAGKTTLLDILAGRTSGRRTVCGTIFLNGHPVTPAQVRGRVGYVHQDDILPGTSTVWEFLSFHAALRLPGLAAEQQSARVRQVVHQLGLSKVAHSFIGDAWVRGLSGGERRRVSIAAQLISAPQLLLLDEPTTGLDSSNAAAVVDILAELAKSGVGVVLTIHQPRPDVFRLMHRVILLSGRGQVVFAGGVNQASEYFEGAGHRPSSAEISIADHMLDVVIRSPPEDVEHLVTTFAGSHIAVHNAAWAASMRHDPWPLPPPCHRAPFRLQMRQLAARALRRSYRHPFLVALNFVAAAVTAVGLALTFHATGYETGGIQSRLGVLFYMLLYLSMMALGSLPLWRQDGLLFARDRDAGLYGTNAYFLSTVASDLGPMRILPPAFFAIVSYWAIGLHGGCGTCVLCFTVILVCANVAAATMAMMIGAACPSDTSANTAGSLAIMASLLFGGFMLNKDQVPGYASWAAAASYFNYAYEALAINEFHRAPTPFFFTSPLNSSVLPTLRVSGEGVLKEFGFQSHRFWGDVVAVVLCSLVFAAVTYVLLCSSDPSVKERLRRATNWRPGTDTTNHADVSTGGLRDRLLSAESEAEVGPQDLQDSHVTTSLLQLVTPGAGTDGEDDSDDYLDANESSVPGVSDENSGYDTSSSSKGHRAPPERKDLHAPHHTAIHISAISSNGSSAATTNGHTADAQHSSAGLDKGRLMLTWEDITYSIPVGREAQPRQILTAVTGMAGISQHQSPDGSRDSDKQLQHRHHRSKGGHVSGGGDMCAILGPSGAGKTTLLDILAGRRSGPGMRGTVRVSGSPVTPDEARSASGYVHQDDVLPGTSTVWEYLSFHAALRLPPGHSPSAASSRVWSLLHQLSLDKVAHSFIGDAWVRGLSGGERRRVSIATELITAPRLLFLDEATTGLDSTNAAAVVDILAHLAGQGSSTTVVLSIHQPRPDVLAMMSRVLILSSNGRMVYSGPVEAAESHFRSLNHAIPAGTNIADWVLDLVIRSPPAQVESLVDGFARSPVAAANAATIARLTSEAATRGQQSRVATRLWPSFWRRQLAVLSKRAARNARRHPALIAINWGATAAVAAALGAVYAGLQRDSGGIQNRLGACAFMTLYFGVLGLSSIPIWFAERLLFIRERAAGLYGTAAYFITGVTWDFLPMRVAPAALFAVVTYPVMGLRQGASHLLRFLGVLVLTNLTGTAMSMAIGAAAPSIAIANTGASLAVLTAALFGGFLMSRAQMPSIARWLSSLSFVRYGYEALLDNEFHGTEGFFFTPYSQKGIPKEKIPSVRVSGDIVLATFGFRPGSSTSDVLVLLILLTALLAATFLFLKWRRQF